MQAKALNESFPIADGGPPASLRGLTIALPVSALLWASIITTVQLIFQ